MVGKKVLDIAINLYSLEHLVEVEDGLLDDTFSFGDVASDATKAVKSAPDGVLTGLFDKMESKTTPLEDFESSLDHSEQADRNNIAFDFAGRRSFFEPTPINNLEFDFRDSSSTAKTSTTTTETASTHDELALDEVNGHTGTGVSSFAHGECDAVEREFVLGEIPIGGDTRKKRTGEQSISRDKQQQSKSSEKASSEISFDMAEIERSTPRGNPNSILGGVMSPQVALLERKNAEVLKARADAITLRLANTKEAIEEREQNMNMYHKDELVSEQEIRMGFKQRSRKPEWRSNIQDLKYSPAEAWRIQLIEDDPLSATSGLKTQLKNKGDGFGTELHSNIEYEGAFPRGLGKIVNVRRRQQLQKTRRVISKGTFEKTATGFIQMRNAKSFDDKDLKGVGKKGWLIKGKPLNKKGTPKAAIAIVNRIKLKQDPKLETFEKMSKKWKTWAQGRTRKGPRQVAYGVMKPTKEAVDAETPWFDRSGYKTPEQRRADQGFKPLDKDPCKSIRQHTQSWEKKKRGRPKKMIL